MEWASMDPSVKSKVAIPYPSQIIKHGEFNREIP